MTMGQDSTMTLNFLCGIFVILIAVAQGKSWRTDPRFEAWNMQGEFILGTPPTCEKAPTPDHGRWICSYGHGDNGRSLCIIDCQKDYVIEDRPLIFNCVNGAWEMFPEAKTYIDVPWGQCVHIEEFRAKVSNSKRDFNEENGNLIERLFSRK